MKDGSAIRLIVEQAAYVRRIRNVTYQYQLYRLSKLVIIIYQAI